MTDSASIPILVTGVPGRIGGVGSTIVEILRRRDLPVRALVRREGQRTDALRANGVEVVAGDLTEARDLARALSGCQRMYFGTHIGKTYELTGPRSQDMHGVAAEYAGALGRPITYVDMPFDQWR